MRKVFAITVLLALSIALTAQPGTHADANPVAEGEIKALEMKLAERIVRGDWDEYEKHLASDYLLTRDNGHVDSKDEALVSLRDVKRKIIVMEMEPADVAIRIYGDTAVSNAEFTTLRSRVRPGQDAPYPPNRRLPEARWPVVSDRRTGHDDRQVVL